MSKILPLLRGSIDLQTALEEDGNILQQLTYPNKRVEFFVHHQHRRNIEALVVHHLGLSRPADCQFSEVREWRLQSFLSPSSETPFAMPVCDPAGPLAPWPGVHCPGRGICFPLLGLPSAMTRPVEETYFRICQK